MQDLSVSVIQSGLYWKDQEVNINMFDQKINEIPGSTDIIVLPEMFSTGFITEPIGCAEGMQGMSLKWMQDKAAVRDCVICGSLLIKEDDKYYNRFIWMEPGGNYSYYDKKHLFRFAGEHKRFTAGNGKLIAKRKGWKIMPLICYDLRFPVWCKNNYTPGYGFDYDILIIVANWPASRSHAWRILLMSRAIENVSYVIGANRTGEDGNGISYSGDSAVISPGGENISNIKPSCDQVETVTMTSHDLANYRNTIRVAEDWDRFTLLQHPGQAADCQ